MIKDEKKILVKIKGATPFIMHSSEGADPNNKWTKMMAPLKAKKTKKTLQDQLEISELSFLSCLYWSDELNGLYIPADNVRKMLLEAGRGCDSRGAKKQIVGVRFTEHLGWPMITKDRDDLEALKNDPNNKYFKIVTIQKSKVPSVRAKFNEWSFELQIIVDTSIVDPETISSWFTYAGSRVGLGCRRPFSPTPGEFGKFYVEEFKEI